MFALIPVLVVGAIIKVEVVDVKDASIKLSAIYENASDFEQDILAKIKLGDRIFVNGYDCQGKSNCEYIKTVLVNNYNVIDKKSFSEVVKFERKRDTLGCDDIRCWSEVAGAYGARYLVSMSSIDILDIDGNMYQGIGLSKKLTFRDYSEIGSIPICVSSIIGSIYSNTKMREIVDFGKSKRSPRAIKNMALVANITTITSVVFCAYPIISEIIF
jgi:hypothetical protein